jgi:hypothetical protein
MADNFEQNKENIKDSKEQLSEFNDSLRESISLTKILSDEFSKYGKSLRSLTKEDDLLISQTKALNKEYKNTLSLSDKLATGKLKEKDVTLQLNKLQEEYNRYRVEAEKAGSLESEAIARSLSSQNKINELVKDKNKSEERTRELYGALDKEVSDLETKRNAAADHGLKISKKELAAAKLKIADIQDEIRLREGIENNLEKQLSIHKKEQTDAQRILSLIEEIENKYKDSIKDNEALLKSLKEQGFASKLLKGNIDEFSKKLQSSIISATSLTTIFEIFKKIAFAVSDQVTKLQKTLVLSREEAYSLRQEFNNVAVASGETLVNTNSLIAANTSLGKQLGFNTKFSNDMNIQFIKLTKQLGISEEAAGGLAKFSIVTGKTLEESKNIAYETAQTLSSQYGLQLDQKDVLEEIGKISGQTLAMFKANPQALAQAVAQAKLLGTSLETTKKQAASLLNFETSIENELQAELLTGQQLNLERARTAALTGDLTTVMKELNSQNIDFNKFSNMNVIAQDKVAAALGLSSDELSDMLLKQQYMGKSQAEVAALAGEEVAERVEAINAQDRFNAAMEKLQDIVGKLVGGPLGQMVDAMASLAENAYVLYGILGAMAGISFVKLIATLAASAVQAGILAAGAITASQAMTFGLSAVGIAAGIGLAMAAFSDAKNEAQQAGDMFSSNGKTIVSPKEGGLFSLSDNDEFAAAPGLGDLLSRPNQQTIATQDNSELIAKFDALIDKTEQTNSALNKLNNKEGKVFMGSQQVGTAQLMANYNLA